MVIFTAALMTVVYELLSRNVFAYLLFAKAQPGPALYTYSPSPLQAIRCQLQAQTQPKYSMATR